MLPKCTAMWSFLGARHKHQLGPICRADEALGHHVGTTICSLCTRPLLTLVKDPSPWTSSFYTTELSKDSDKTKPVLGKPERVGPTQGCLLCCNTFQKRQLGLSERERQYLLHKGNSSQTRHSAKPSSLDPGHANLGAC